MIKVKEFLTLEELNMFLVKERQVLRFIDLKYYAAKENFHDQIYMLVYEVLY